VAGICGKSQPLLTAEWNPAAETPVFGPAQFITRTGWHVNLQGGAAWGTFAAQHRLYFPDDVSLIEWYAQHGENWREDELQRYMEQCQGAYWESAHGWRVKAAWASLRG
jgi:hypothetical protein